MFAIEKLIPSFDHTYGGVFYAPNILSYGLAALMCPLKPDIVLYGIASKDMSLAQEVIKKFFPGEIRIVSSNTTEAHYMDELNVMGKSRILNTHYSQIEELEFAKRLHLPLYQEEDIRQMPSKKENVGIVVDILRGRRKDAYEDITCLNAGNILELSGISSTIEEGYKMAKEQVESGKAFQKLLEIIQESGGDSNQVSAFMQ